MVRVEKKDDKYSLVIDSSEFEKLNLSVASDYDIIRLKDGAYALVEKGKIENTPKVAVEEKKDEIVDSTELIDEKPSEKSTPLDDISKTVLEKLEKANLSSRVVGKFELTLNTEEKKVLVQLVEIGVLKEFKLSDKYKKAIYKQADSEKYEDKDSVFSKPVKFKTDFTLDKDGFMIIKNESQAKMLSLKLADKIKKKEVMGTRSFDGNYYVIDSWRYRKYEFPIIKHLKENGETSIDDLSKEVNAQVEIVKIICELLREKGELIEKRSNVFQFIE